MQRALSKTRQKVGWITRTFMNREVKFLRTLWNSLAQPHMDYGSILWAPVRNKTELLAAESPLRMLTRMARGCSELNYWERLKVFKLYSNQRRMERYKIMYIWKSLNGPCHGLKLEWNEFSQTNRSGSTLKTSKTNRKFRIL